MHEKLGRLKIVGIKLNKKELMFFLPRYKCSSLCDNFHSLGLRGFGHTRSNNR